MERGECPYTPFSMLLDTHLLTEYWEPRMSIHPLFYTLRHTFTYWVLRTYSKPWWEDQHFPLYQTEAQGKRSGSFYFSPAKPRGVEVTVFNSTTDFPGTCRWVHYLLLPGKLEVRSPETLSSRLHPEMTLPFRQQDSVRVGFRVSA